MKRVLSVALCVVIVVGGIIGGVGIAKEVVDLRKLGASIEEQKQMQSLVFDKKAQMRDEMAKEKLELSEIPDSLKATRTGKAMKVSKVFVKTEARLDPENMRIKKILRKLASDKTALEKRLNKGVMIFAGVELLLVVCLVVVRRFVL